MSRRKKQDLNLELNIHANNEKTLGILMVHQIKKFGLGIKFLVDEYNRPTELSSIKERGYIKLNRKDEEVKDNGKV